MSCWGVELDRNGSSHSLPAVTNTLQKILFTQKEKGRQIITFIGHSFSRVNKDLLEKIWLVAGIYIFFVCLKNTFGSTALYNTNRRSDFCLITSGRIFLLDDGAGVDGAHIVQFLMSLTIFSFVS